MTYWEYADRDQWCGGREECRIKAGEPMFFIKLEKVSRVLVRCQSCAWGPVDWAACEAAKKKREDANAEKERAKREFTPLKAFAHKVLKFEEPGA